MGTDCFRILAPGGPELEEHYFTLDRRVVKLISGGSLGAEVRSWLTRFVACEGTESGPDNK
jgi:hypothetical protein